MLSYCCTNNANRSRVSLRSSFSNCHVLFRYMHSSVHASFNYRTATMRCRGPWVPSTDYSISILVDVNWTVIVIIRFRIFDDHQSCWWHHIFLRKRTAVDADDRCGWTQIFGGIGRSTGRKAQFLPTHLHFTPAVWGDSIGISQISYAS